MSRASRHCIRIALPAITSPRVWVTPERVIRASPVPAHVQMFSLMKFIYGCLFIGGRAISNADVIIIILLPDTGMVEPIGM